MIPQEAVEALARHNFEESYRHLGWDELTDDVKAGWLKQAQGQCEAAAPLLRAQALECAADELLRLHRIGRKPNRDSTENERADYYSYAEYDSDHESWLRARAVTERGDDASKD